MPTSLGTAELARRVAAVLDETSRGLAAFGGTSTAVGAMLSWLERESLTAAEVMEVLGHLRTSGHLAAFLNQVSHRDLRRFLREKQVPWHFVLQNWEPSVNDSGLFFAGFVVGAGESLTELLRLVVAVVGSPFSAELAAERDKFWGSVRFLASPEFAALLRQFAASPGELARLGLDRYASEVESRLWNLEFYEAGRLLGYTLATVLTVLGALKKLPALLRTLSKIARELAEISLAQLRQLGAPLSRLREFLTSPAQQLVTPEGFVFAKAADEVVVIDRAARPVGKLQASKALRELAGGADEAAPTAAKTLHGFARLNQGALAWLDANDLLALARRVLRRPGIRHLDEIIDAINRLYSCQDFDKVAGLWLRGLKGSTVLHRNMEKGASLVMRYCLAELKDLPAFAIVFETNVTKLFRRFTDVLIPGVKIEFKAVAGYSPRIAKQLVRDLTTNLGRDLERLKGLRFVFERAQLRVSEAALRAEIRAAVAERLAGHPRLAEIQAAVDKIITLWP